MTAWITRSGLFCILMLVCVACGSKQQADPQVAEAFVERYQAAYAARDREAILLMIDWSGVDEELRDYTKAAAYPDAGGRIIRTIESEPHEASGSDARAHGGRPIEPATEPTLRIEIVFEPIDQNALPERFELLAVERDGEISLCGWTYTD